MSKPASTPRPIVIRTSRETLSLVVAAAAMTFAMSYAIHAKHERLVATSAPATIAAQDTPATQPDWTGHLAELAPVGAPSAEPLSSAALVVPKSALALPLPQPPARPRAARQCGDAACLGGKSPAAAPKRQIVVAVEETKPEKPDAPKTGILHQLNPLNHLPDMSVVGRPFSYAGGAVAGWFKKL